MRGKHAARAANGRAEQLAAEVQQLRRTLADSEAAHAKERADLKAEVGQLRNRLISEVEKLSREEVRRAQEGARSELAASEAKYRDRCKDAFNFLHSIGTQATHETWVRLSEILGVQFMDMVSGALSRNQRRTTNKAARYKMNIDNNRNSRVVGS